MHTLHYNTIHACNMWHKTHAIPSAKVSYPHTHATHNTHKQHMPHLWESLQLSLGQSSAKGTRCSQEFTCHEQDPEYNDHETGSEDLCSPSCTGPCTVHADQCGHCSDDLTPPLHSRAPAPSRSGAQPGSQGSLQSCEGPMLSSTWSWPLWPGLSWEPRCLRLRVEII